MPFWKPKKKPQGQPVGQGSQQSAQDATSELPAESPNRVGQAEIFLERADENFANGDYSRAIMLYEEALLVQPDNSLILLKRSQARMLLEPPQLDLALQDVNSAIERQPTLGQAWRQKGDIYMLLNDFPAAQDALQHAVGSLQGMEKVQAQRALAECRLKSERNSAIEMPAAQTLQTSPNAVSPLAVSPASPVSSQRSTRSPVPVISQPVQPGPQPSAPAASRPLTSHTSLPERSASQNLNPPEATPVQSVSLPSSAQTLTAGLAAPSSPMGVQSPPPNPDTLRDRAAEDLAQQLNIPQDPPPSYTPNPPIPANLASGRVAGQFDSQLTTMTNALATRRQGSLFLRPYTAAGQIDSVQILYYGKTYLESIILDLGPAPQMHASFKNYHVDVISYPGNTFLDMDCETAASHEGLHLGTVSVSGYTEEYREYQQSLKPALSLILEAQTIPPVMNITSIVSRLQLLQLQPSLEDNQKLAEILGLPTVTYLASPSRQTQIEDICMIFHRGQYVAPNRFIDLSKATNFSSHFFGTLTGIGLTNFLFQILLGAELLIRLRKEPRTTSYAGIMSDATSALVVLSQLWMENVTIRVLPALAPATALAPQRYTLVANNNQRQAEGLIRFAEALAWPYLDEARQYIENAYTNLIGNPSSIGHHLKDWLYGLVLPGKIFRHRIMSCLVDASPSLRSIGAAPYWDNGIVVQNKSYWPKRSVLGRVLGGLRNPKSTCGWIGPVPAPVGGPSGWVRLNARPVAFAVPVTNGLESSLEILGFSEADLAEDPQRLIQDLSDMNRWNPPIGLPAKAADQVVAVRLEKIRLQETPPTGAVTAYSRQYSASLDFTVNGKRVTYTLYSNPVFVHAPACIGSSHPIHARQVQKYLANSLKVADLKDSSSLPNVLTIIDATDAGEEAVARAWCAERARHAIVRRDGKCCFTCATNLASTRMGLGFNVLIWCR